MGAGYFLVMTQYLKNTTVHIVEPRHDPYIITLAPELIEIVKSGAKAKTYRLGDKYDYLKVGDEIKILNTITREFAIDAIITNKYFQKFIDLPVGEPGHEAYKDKESQRRVFNGYYAFRNEPIKDDDNFLVVEFLKK